MVVFSAEWAQHFGEHLVTAYPPGGGRFRFFERIRPTADFASIVERILVGDLTFKVSEVGTTLRIVTEDGEYGAWVRIQGTRGNRQAQRCIGAIFTEDFAAALDALADTPAIFDEMANRSIELIRSATFGLGRRQRLFYYTPPPGWQALPGGLSANWYPLDFPRNRSNIIVQPALPLESAPDDLIAARLNGAGAGLKVEDSLREPVTSARKLSGWYLKLRGSHLGSGERIYRDIAVFATEQYLYVFRMETASPERLAEVRELFRCVVTSFQPLPSFHERRIGQAFTSASTLLDHWAS